jgi:hypothetical protein
VSKIVQVKIRYSIKSFSVLFLLVACSLLQTGCATSTPDPLAGWRFYRGDHFDKAITDDYKDYIQKLPPKIKYYIDPYSIWLFEDGTGQHAVKIEIPLHGTYREDVLFYDKDDKRIGVKVYSDGRYAS